MKRRDFLSSLAAGCAVAASPMSLKARTSGKAARVTLLLTTDTHDHLDPFPAGSGRQSGLGGIARRATLVKRLRKELGNVLLLDAGDAFQGTPYFNEWKGKLDFKLMSLVGYDAVTLGNHDFDDGVDGLLGAMKEATFPFVCSNLDFSGAPELGKRVAPVLIREMGGVKIGILGATYKFDRMVLPENHTGVAWLDPVASLTPLVKKLRDEDRCDLIVLTSHLGMKGTPDRPGNLEIASLVPGIHAIISGHTHLFMPEPTIVKNALGETVVFEAGYGGTEVGRLDFSFKDGRIAAWSHSAARNA